MEARGTTINRSSKDKVLILKPYIFYKLKHSTFILPIKDNIFLLIFQLTKNKRIKNILIIPIRDNYGD